MKMKKIGIVAALLLPMTSFAVDNGMHGSMSDMQQGSMDKPMSMDGMSQKMFLKKKQVDGYTVSFHAMMAKEGMQHGGSHNFMVKVEKEDRPADVIAVNSKVKHPNGQEESKMMMKMGAWHVSGYNLDHEGRHQLMVLFKTADGSKHFGGVFFP